MSFKLQPSCFNRALSTLFALMCVAGSIGYAQPYTLDWWTLDGGGGTSTGGVYSVSGTIGQPDAGAMSGGDYTLVSGFWGVVSASQADVAPYLAITASNNTVIMSWPSAPIGWRLEAADALPQGTGSWIQINPPYETNGANLQFTELLPAGSRFYRLRK